MKTVLFFLSRWPVILVTFLAMLAIGYSFSGPQAELGGQLLDFIFTGETARNFLATLSEAQKSLHIRVTLLNDTAYPIAYTACLAGLIYRLSGTGSAMLTVPAFLGFGLDLAENAVQVLALSGTVDLLVLKTLLTPLKFAAVTAAFVIVIGLAIKAVTKRLAKG